MLKLVKENPYLNFLMIIIMVLDPNSTEEATHDFTQPEIK